MKSEKGITLIEVVWSIVIIASFGVCIFNYRFKQTRILVNSITDKYLMIDYARISEMFRCEYDHFEDIIDELNNEEDLYVINIPDTSILVNIELIYEIEIINQNTLYSLTIKYPEELKNRNYSLFNDRKMVVFV